MNVPVTCPFRTAWTSGTPWFLNGTNGIMKVDRVCFWSAISGVAGQTTAPTRKAIKARDQHRKFISNLSIRPDGPGLASDRDEDSCRDPPRKHATQSCYQLYPTNESLLVPIPADLSRSEKQYRWINPWSGPCACTMVDRISRITEGGGAEGIRTPDLFNANEALYQLSHSPTRLRLYRVGRSLSTEIEPVRELRSVLKFPKRLVLFDHGDP